MGSQEVMNLTRAQIHQIASEGYGAITTDAGGKASTGWQTFTSCPGTGVEKKLAAVIPKVTAAGLKVFLNLPTDTYDWAVSGSSTPWVNWFSGDWALVDTQVKNYAAAAKCLGASGILFDDELYALSDSPAAWEWNYLGNTHDEAATRAKVSARGAEIMNDLTTGFPDLEVLSWADYFDGPSPNSPTFCQYISNRADHTTNSYGNDVYINFWQGAIGVGGYKSITFFDECFQWTANVTGNGLTWTQGLNMNISSYRALFPEANVFTEPSVNFDCYRSDPPSCGPGMSPGYWKRTVSGPVWTAVKAENDEFMVFNYFGDSGDQSAYKPLSR